MTRRIVLLAVSLIIASVGCDTKPKEASKPVVTDTAAVEQQPTSVALQQPTPSTPQPFVLPEHIARCIANELVVTTYLRGGPEHLTVDTDIVLSQDATQTSDEFLAYGIGMPLLQWTYDGRTLTKADAWRALVSQTACDGDYDELFITYCVWDRIDDRSPEALGDCVHRIAGLAESLRTDEHYVRTLRRANAVASRIIDANLATINAVVKRLQRPHHPTRPSIMSGVGDASVDECGVPQWQFGWYRDILREQPISPSPVRGVIPGTYPIATDDGACPKPGPAHPRTISQLVTLNVSLDQLQDVLGYYAALYIRTNGSPRLIHFLNVQFDPNDFRAIPQIDAVVAPP